jgi:hypothetical protein
MHGGITEDGESALIVYKAAGGDVKVYASKSDGFTPRRLPRIRIRCTPLRVECCLTIVSKYFHRRKKASVYKKETH